MKPILFLIAILFSSSLRADLRPSSCGKDMGTAPIAVIYKGVVANFQSLLKKYDEAKKAKNNAQVQATKDDIEGQKDDMECGLDMLRLHLHELSKEQQTEFISLDKRLNEFGVQVHAGD